MKYKIRVECRVETGLDDMYSRNPYDGYSHEVRTDHKFIVTTDDKEKYPDATVETDLDDPIFVFVLYSSGGTFGRTDGYDSFIGVIERTHINKMSKLIYDSARNRHNKGSIMSIIGDMVGRDIYDCWNGYFEHLENVVFVDKDGFTLCK